MAPSRLGPYHYEVADTKLARKVKGGALLQMCVYLGPGGRHPGVMPIQMHVALGGSGHHVESHRLDDYLAYYRSVKGRFLDAIAAGDPVYPLPLDAGAGAALRGVPLAADLRRLAGGRGSPEPGRFAAHGPGAPPAQPAASGP